MVTHELLCDTFQLLNRCTLTYMYLKVTFFNSNIYVV